MRASTNLRALRAAALAGLVSLAFFALLTLGAFVAHDVGAGMDNPTPPLVQVNASSPELTQGIGYCVSVGIGDQMFGHVSVPLHRPDRAQLDELRVSIANSYRLVALQQKDPEKAAALRAAAERIRLPGEPDLTVSRPAGRNRRGGLQNSPGGVSCTCATYYGCDVTASCCGGGCSDCYLCK